MVKVFKALVILIGVTLVMSEEIRNYKEKRDTGIADLSMDHVCLSHHNSSRILDLIVFHFSL